MKFRTMLFASAAVMFTTSAMAADDITGAFYLPTKGKFLSNTSLEMSRGKMDFGPSYVEDVEKGLYASEELTYGITDNFAVVGYIGNHFDYDKEYNNDHNFEYGVGVKYNHNFDKVLTQVGLGYRTADLQSWYGQDYDDEDFNDRWAKFIQAEAKLGYAFDCGLTPYTTFSVLGGIDRGNNERVYNWFAGAHKKWDRVAADLGVNYTFGKEAEWKVDASGLGDGHNENWALKGELHYFVKDNFTVGAYGSYYIGGDEREDVDYDYTVGLNAKVVF